MRARILGVKRDKSSAVRRKARRHFLSACCEDEQLRIVLSRQLMGGRVPGYADGALDVFGRPLDELDDLELAQLVVITHWPSRLRKPEYADDRESAARSPLTRSRSGQ